METKKQRIEKSVEIKDSKGRTIRKSVTVEEVENGFIISIVKDVWGGKGNEEGYETKKYISAVDPFKKKEDDGLPKLDDSFLPSELTFDF